MALGPNSILLSELVPRQPRFLNVRFLKAGDSYQIPLEAIHDAKSGPSGAKVLAVYVVRKGEPLASPAK
jgi:hypothetical protein